MPTLHDVCAELELPWDAAMLHWSKSRDQIKDTSRGNETFWASAPAPSLQDAIDNRRALPPCLSREELEWIESRFAQYNAINDYPSRIESADDEPVPETRPSFSSSGRFVLFQEIGALRDRVAELSIALDESPLCRGRLLACLINALPYPRRMVRAYRCHRRVRRERSEDGHGATQEF
ncbi:MAG: hypothetical protein C1943_03295 [Halochromatium sp.]|nr:hypothetical protein [Halochromatium sp.]